MIVPDLFFVRRRSYYGRLLLALELSVVPFFLGKTKVEKIRICGNYNPIYTC